MSAVTYPIGFGPYRADISAAGAGLRMLEREVDGAAWPLTETWGAGEKPPLSAGLTLCPWPNRVKDGKYSFDGVDYELEITEAARNNASHGLVRRKDWDVVSNDDSSVSLTTTTGQAPGWPFELTLTNTYSLDETGLRVTFTATNTGTMTAPFGLGMHTFVRAGDAPIDECSLVVPAGVYQPLDPDRLVPVGAPVAVWDTEFDFTKSRSLDGVWLDTPFSSLLPDEDGITRYQLLDNAGGGTVLWTDTAFKWVQVFTADPARDQAYPNRGRALAVEPMTCAGNAFNTGIDLVRLEPGRSWTGSWGMHTL